MKAKDYIISVLCFAVGLSFLFGASRLIEPIHSQRKEFGLVLNEPLENAPPSLAFATVAMGAFRGLVVDILWMRADKLKEEGQFFDAKQLAEWITVLQPRFASVWDFQAWNMAYNISVTFPASQCNERWRWVKNGYELLRDKGIEMNPNSILLYRSLAWTFQHKIGGVTDDCHKYYRLQLAFSIRQLLGQDPPNEYFLRLSNAPRDIAVLEQDPKVTEILQAFADADEAFKDEDAVINNYLSMMLVPERYPKAFEVVDKYRGTEALGKLDLFIKAWHLRNTWKLEPAKMYEMNNMYGPVSYEDPNEHFPLPWEHADPHAMYWAQVGLERAGNDGDFTANEKNTDRIISHSLQSLYRQGKMIIYPVGENGASLFLMPDIRYFDVVDSDWLSRIRKYELSEKRRPTGMLSGHKNFLKNAIFSFYQIGRKQKARQIFSRLRKEYPEDDNTPPSLESFITARLKEEVGSITIKDATELIMFSLQEMFFRYALREDENAAGIEAWAKRIYDTYQAEFGDEEVRRVDLPEFGRLKYQAFLRFVNDPYYPETVRRNLVGRIQVEEPELYEKIKDFAEKQKETQQRLQKQSGQQ